MLMTVVPASSLCAASPLQKIDLPVLGFGAVGPIYDAARPSQTLCIFWPSKLLIHINKP
jgi:hypothetical protein